MNAPLPLAASAYAERAKVWIYMDELESLHAHRADLKAAFDALSVLWIRYVKELSAYRRRYG